jgi:hypothetical protein
MGHDAIVHVGNPMGVMKNSVIVCDDNDGSIWSDCSGREQLHHGLTRLVVQRSRRLIADDQTGLMNKRSGQCDPLLLAAREHLRHRMHSVSHSQPLQEFRRALHRHATANPIRDQRHGGILSSGE